MCICKYTYISVTIFHTMIIFWIYWVLLQSLSPVFILILILESLILHLVCYSPFLYWILLIQRTASHFKIQNSGRELRNKNCHKVLFY